MDGHAVQIDAGRNIIAGDKTDAEFGQAEPFRQPRNGTRGSERIGRTKIAKDGNTRTRRISKDRFQQPFQHGFIARFGIAPAFKLRKRHGAFAQTFKEQGSRQAALDQAPHHGDGRIHAITGKTGAIADEKQITHAMHSLIAAPSVAASLSSKAIGLMASRPWPMRPASR